MIRHVVMFRWTEHVTPAQVEAVSAGLSRLPGLIDDIRRYEFGPDLGIADGNLDYVVVADFDDADGYRRYRDHPDHQALIAGSVGPITSERVAVQYELVG